MLGDTESGEDDDDEKENRARREIRSAAASVGVRSGR
jgi:hypothetical protein